MRGRLERGVARRVSGAFDLVAARACAVCAMVLAALAMTIVPASAQKYAALPDRVAPLQAVGGAQPIPAWRVFCERHPIECAVDPREARQITLTPQIWDLIVRVNRAVNAEITPMTDMEQWGVADSWDFPKTGYGDCEDYQLLKRKRLAEAGLPRRAMRMTVVIDEQGEGHAVLMIRTDRGDFILDNVTDEVVSWHETPYIYVSRESQHAIAWTSLGHTVAPTATAAR